MVRVRSLAGALTAFIAVVPAEAGSLISVLPSSGSTESVKDRDSVRRLIAAHAARNNIPPALADAIVRVESRYNPRASNGVNLGLTQLSLSTARSLGYKGSKSGLLDADTNLRFGMRYLARAYQLARGDTCSTVLKYQAGPRATTMTGAALAYCAKVKTDLASAE